MQGTSLQEAMKPYSKKNEEFEDFMTKFKKDGSTEYVDLSTQEKRDSFQFKSSPDQVIKDEQKRRSKVVDFFNKDIKTEVHSSKES